jgi:hypothetical protein
MRKQLSQQPFTRPKKSLDLGPLMEWNESTCAQAALRGNLSMLQWLRDNDCPWSSTLLENARVYGHQNILDWAIAYGCPDCE